MFFQRFKALAEKKDGSANATAKIIGISSGTITAWKNGTQPTKNSLKKVAEYFDVSTNYLIGAETSGDTPATNAQLKFALFGDTEIDDETLDDIKAIAKVHAERKKNKGI